MSKLTGTHSEVAAYEFTTLTTVPGTLKVHGAPIQILDLREQAFAFGRYLFLMLPFLAGIIEGAKDGRGRGKQVIAGMPCAWFYYPGLLITDSFSGPNLQSDFHCFGCPQTARRQGDH